MTARSITIIDVCRELGVEPTKELTWSVGTSVRAAYESVTGYSPEKRLRTKTGGGGSHCFAVYPYTFKHEIARIIRSHEAHAASQFDLFQF